MFASLTHPVFLWIRTTMLPTFGEDWMSPSRADVGLDLYRLWGPFTPVI